MPTLLVPVAGQHNNNNNNIHVCMSCHVQVQPLCFCCRLLMDCCLCCLRCCIFSLLLLCVAGVLTRPRGRGFALTSSSAGISKSQRGLAHDRRLHESAANFEYFYIGLNADITILFQIIAVNLWGWVSLQFNFEFKWYRIETWSLLWDSFPLLDFE